MLNVFASFLSSVAAEKTAKSVDSPEERRENVSSLIYLFHRMFYLFVFAERIKRNIDRFPALMSKNLNHEILQTLHVIDILMSQIR